MSFSVRPNDSKKVSVYQLMIDELTTSIEAIDSFLAQFSNDDIVYKSWCATSSHLIDKIKELYEEE